VDSFSGSHACITFFSLPETKDAVHSLIKSWAAVLHVGLHPQLQLLNLCLLTVQPAVLKDCPDKMVVTVTQCLFSTVQSFVVAVVAERDFSKWKLRFDISLLAILYSVSSAFFLSLVHVQRDVKFPLVLFHD
jgi:hypothetical protein